MDRVFLPHYSCHQMLSSSSASGIGTLAVVFALLEMVGGFLLPCDATRPLLREQPERIVAVNADTLDIPTVEEARQMIIEA